MGLDYMKNWPSMQNNFKDISNEETIEIEKKLKELEEAGKIGKDQEGDAFDVINKNDRETYKDLKKAASISDYEKVDENLKRLGGKIEKEMEAEFTESKARENAFLDETQINKINKTKEEIIQLNKDLEIIKKDKADNSFMTLINKKIEIAKKEDELHNLIQSN